MTPKVSICIPTYNRKDYLRQTLDSVYTQTYKDFEVVVVDDGSIDGTENMIKTDGYNLKYYWQQNRGEPAARNKLVELAKGQFVTFLDSDDLLLPDAVERMIRVVETEKEDVIVYGSYMRIDENGNIYGRCKRTLYSGNITEYLFQEHIVHSCGSMFPKRAILETGGFDESLPVCADYDLWLRLSLKYRFIALPEITFKRRRHSSNISIPSSKNQLVELKVLECFYYEKGGDKVIPRRIAMQRLSREQYRAGKYLLKEKKFGEAVRYFRASFNRYPNPKALLMWGLYYFKASLH